MAKYCTQELFSKFLIWKVKSYAKCKAIDRNFKNYNFNLKNDTAHLLEMLIFLLGYTDYDLDYKRQGIYWWLTATKQKGFYDRTSKMGSQCAEQQIWWAKFTNPAIMTSQRQSPASGLPLRWHCGQNPSSGQPKLQTLATLNQMQNSSSGSFTMLAMNQ